MRDGATEARSATVFADCFDRDGFFRSRRRFYGGLRRGARRLERVGSVGILKGVGGRRGAGLGRVGFRSKTRGVWFPGRRRGGSRRGVLLRRRGGLAGFLRRLRLLRVASATSISSSGSSGAFFPFSAASRILPKLIWATAFDVERRGTRNESATTALRILR